MNSALAAEGNNSSNELERAPAAPTEFPQGLKPDSFLPLNGAAEAAPLQNLTSGSANFHWTWWTLVPLTLVAAVVAAPYFLTHGFLAIGLALDRGFAIVCHQRPERSFWISGGAVAVCSRCLGIYLGTAVGLLFRTSRSIALRLLIVSAALNLFDAITELAGLHGNWLVIRFAFGLLLGAAVALLISAASIDT